MIYRLFLPLMFAGALAACQPAAKVSDAPSAETDHADHAAPSGERHVMLEETGQAGGVAHEHGAGEMVIVISDGATVSLRAPVASFGLSESEEELTLPDGVGAALFGLPDAAGCDVARETISGTRADGHAELTVTIEYACDALAKLDKVTFKGFSHADGLAFEDVDAVFITSDGQVAAELSPNNAVIARR